MTNTATPKQISYALDLLDRNGFSTRWMDKTFSQLGATMKQRSGKVEDWLAKMTKTEISRLISELSA
jgi:hypothetical protein